MVRWLVALAASIGLSGVAQAQSSPSNFTNAVRYDLAGQVTGTIAANAMGSMGGALPYQAVRNSYDMAGRLTKVERGYLSDWPGDAAPASWSGFTIVTIVDATYDASNRKTSEAVSGVVSQVATIRQFTQFSYDALDRLECAAVRMNPASFGSLATGACALTAASAQYGSDRITRNTYDAAGQLLKVQKGYGTALQQDYATYEYTLNGRQKTVIDANGNRAELTWDGFDRQAAWYFPSKTTAGAASTSDYEAYGYDANNNRTSLRKRDGRTIAYAYDALNRVTSKTYPNGGARPVYYAYDLRGLQTAARFDGASGGDAVTSVWDGFGRQTSNTTSMGGVSRTLGSGYNTDGQRNRMTYPDGNYVNYHRYDSGALYYADMSGNVPLFHTPLDTAGRVQRLFGWNVSAGNWGPNVEYAYDDLSRVAMATQTLTGGTGNVVTGFGYNPVGQIVSRSRDNDAYAFNGFVNVSRDYARNGLNQYTSAGPASFGYDDNGNLTSDGTSTYAYDIENRLTARSTGAGLVYDPLGRLYETSVSGGNITRFLYDGDALVAEYDAGGNMLKRYVHSDGADDPLVQYAGAGVGSPNYLFADHQGSVVAITDANGAATQINSYDEYGIPGLGNAGRFQYTGQAWLPDLGLYYYKARIYSPTLGRFLQTDPIGYDDQINLYAYVANDPVNGRDPTGTYLCGANSAGQCNAVDGALSQAREALGGMKGQAAKDLRAAISAWGVRGKDNGVTVKAGDTAIANTSTKDGRTTVTISSRIDSFAKLSQARQDAPGGFVAAHEGQHIIDERAMGRDPRTAQERYNVERRGYALQGQVDRALGAADGGYMPVWRPGMNDGQMDRAARENAWSSVCRGGTSCSSVDMYP